MLTVGQLKNFLGIAQNGLEVVVKTSNGYCLIDSIKFASSYDNEYEIDLQWPPNNCIVLETEE